MKPAALPRPLEHFLEALYRKRGCSVYLFGSWARGEANPTDIDLAIVGSLSEAELAELREALEELSFPYQVDLISYHQAPLRYERLFSEKASYGSPPAPNHRR